MNVEKLSVNPVHFETHHENQKDLICMGHSGECAVLVEIAGSTEEKRILETAAERALTRLDDFFEGRFSELFQGLHIWIGDELTESGGETWAEANKIIFDRQKALLSLKEAEELLALDQFRAPVLEHGDWTSVMSQEDAARPGSCLEYNIIHEVGHLLDEQLDDGKQKHRVTAADSPTRYGRVGDQHNNEKDHEAFAELVAYVVFDRPVAATAEQIVRETIQARMMEKKL